MGVLCMILFTFLIMIGLCASMSYYPRLLLGTPTCGSLTYNPVYNNGTPVDVKLFFLNPNDPSSMLACTTLTPDNGTIPGNYSVNQLTLSAVSGKQNSSVNQLSGYRAVIKINQFVTVLNHGFFSIWKANSSLNTSEAPFRLQDVLGSPPLWRNCSLPPPGSSYSTLFSSLLLPLSGNSTINFASNYFSDYGGALGVCFFSDSFPLTATGVEWSFSPDPCPENYYCPDGATSPTPCPSGKFSTEGSFNPSQCLPCSRGTSSTLGGPCLPCEIGRFGAIAGSPNCSLCNPGSYSNASGLTSCSLCSPGFYSSSSGAASCVPCPGGYYGNTFGLSSPQCTGACKANTFSSSNAILTTNNCSGLCAAGQTSLPGVAICSKCPPNTYSTEKGSNCTPCPPNELSFPGSTRCSTTLLCVAGQYFDTDSSSCKNCLLGTYSVDGAKLCTASCPVNTFLSLSKCLQCPSWQISPGGNATSCTNAPCYGICLYNSSTIDNRRLALPCSSSIGSRVFLFKDLITPSFYFNLESNSALIITNITIAFDSTAVKIGWMRNAFQTSPLSPLIRLPINALQATDIFKGLLICGDSSFSSLTITLSITLVLSSFGASSPATSTTTKVPLVLMGSIPPFPLFKPFSQTPGNLTISKASPFSPQLSSSPPSTTVIVSLQGAPIKPWFTSNYSSTLSWSSDSPTSLSRVTITIDRGCVPGDTLLITAPFFGLVTNFTQPRCSTSSVSGIEMKGSGNLYEFLAVLDSLQFIPSTNPFLSSANLPRVIKYQFDNVPTNLTLFTTLTVTPGNLSSSASPIQLSSNSTLSIMEGYPPDFAIAVMPFCPTTSPLASAFIHGVPSLCFSSPDSPAFRFSDDVDAYAGPKGGPLLMQLGTNFTVIITTQTANPPFSSCISESDWSAEPVGVSVSDCSFINPDNMGGATQPLLCFWQRYRIVLPKGRASYSGSIACGADCPLDFESSCLLSTTSSPPLSLPASVTVLSSQQASVFGSPGNSSINVGFTLSLTDDVNELPQLAWPDSQSLTSLGFSATTPLPPNSPLIIDDTTGQPNATLVPHFLYCSQNSGTLSPSFSLPPLEGISNSTLPVGSNGLNSFLNYRAALLSSPRKLWLNDTPACSNALSLMPLSGVYTEPMSWAFVTPLSIAGIGSSLRQIPARSLTVYVQPYPGSPKSSAFLIPVLLTRNNRPVSWNTSNPSILNLAENTSPFSNTTSNLTVFDADFEQDVTFKILSVSLAYCKSPSSIPTPTFQVPEGLFVPISYPKSIGVIDYATGSSSTVLQTRVMSVGVGVDALDIDSAAFACGVTLLPDLDFCLFNVTIQAMDNGNFTPSHSLLPLQPPTFASKTFSITVKKDGSNALPLLTGIIGIPPLGLSTGGGDTLVFIGTGLGLPAGPTSNVSIVFHNGDFNAFPLLNCTVITRLSRVKCITSPGFDNVTHVSIRVGATGELYPRVTIRCPLPFFQRPQVVAVLDYNGTAAWHGVLSGVSPLTSFPTPPGPAYITLLVDATSQLIPLTLGVSINVWAGLRMDFDSVLPLGACSPSTHPTIANGNIYWEGLVGGGQRFNLPSLKQSASWFDCPLSSSLSAVSFREVMVKVNYSRSISTPFSLYGGPFSTLSTEGTQWWANLPGITKPNVAVAKRSPPLITSVTQITQGGTFIITGTNLGASNLSWWSDRVEYASLDTSGTLNPCFVSQEQSPPYLTTLGSGTVSTFSLASPSCAIHKGVGCRYTVPHTQLACDMELGGWGGGFRVRVIVGGQSTPWFPPLPSTIIPNLTYAPPIITGYTVASVMGMNKSTSMVMEPSGGGLLVIQGRNLWPPEALVITVGGVRVYPLNARPLNSQSPTLPSACTSLGPWNTSNTTNSFHPACFGDAPQLWSTTLPELTQGLGKAVVVVYPPGLGVVAIEVALGSFRTSFNATYSPPTLLGVATAAPFQGINGSYTLFLYAASLSPCALCRVNGSSTYPLGFVPPQCAFIMDNPMSSANLSTLIPGALPGALEGSLPYPFAATNFSVTSGSNVALENCALPSDLWVWNSDGGGGGSSSSSSLSYRSRTVTQFPFPAFQQDTRDLAITAVNMRTYSGGDLMVVQPVSLVASQATLALKYRAFSPASTSTPIISFGGSVLSSSFGTNSSLSNSSSSGGSNSSTSTSGTLKITAEDLKVLRVAITNIPLSIEVTDIALARAKQYTLRVDNTGPYGALFVTPTFQNGATLWRGGPIVCPMTPSTTLSLTNLEGKVITPVITSFFSSSPFNLQPPTNFSDPAVFLDITGDLPSWRTSASPTLPCRIISWQGSSSITSLALSGQTLVVTLPAWIGMVSVRVFSKDSFSAGVNVSYAAPSVLLATNAMQPNTGSSSGGTSVVINGTHFGSAGSLGELWYKTGAAGVYTAINASGSLLPQKRANGGSSDATLQTNQFTDLWPQVYGPEDFPHKVFFAYDTSAPTDDTAALRRYCVSTLGGAPTSRILNWTDTTIQCLTPEGVAGSSNIPYISMNFSSSLPPSSNNLVPGRYAKFKYDSPFLSGVWIDWFSTPPLVHLNGVGLSRFDSNASRTAAASTPGTPASSTDTFWRYTINALGVARGLKSLGAVNRLQTQWVAPNLPNQTFSALSYNNTEIVFPAPFIEGSVSFSITLSPSLGSPLYSNPVTYTIEPPLVTSVTVISSGPGDYDANPCTDIEKAMADWVVDRNRSSITRHACLANILSFAYRNFTLDSSSSASCFRVTPSSTTGTTALRVTGRFFGGGKAVTSISLTSILSTTPAAATASSLSSNSSSSSGGGSGNLPPSFTLSGKPRFCTIDQTLSTWSTIPQGLSSIVCYLQTSESATYSTGPMAVTLLGYQDTVSPFLPLKGVCPCGYFSTNELGSPCQPCEDNAFCLGGTFAPLALPDYWRTDKDEWKDLREINTVAAGVAPFVACPTPGQCLADNQCVEGAVGFMCTQCLATDLVTYKRGSAGNCVKCSPYNSRLLVFLVSLGGLTVIVAALSMPWCCTRVLCCARFVTGVKGCMSKVQCGGCCGRCCSSSKASPLGGDGGNEEGGEGKEEDRVVGGSKGPQSKSPQREPKPQGLLPLIKIAITFFQTLAAVSLLTSTNYRARTESPDGLVLPKVIQSLTFFLDFGFSLSEFKCAASISYQGQIIMFILLPILCTLALGPALDGLRVVYERTQRHLHAYLSRTLSQVPDLPKFTPYSFSSGALTTSLLFLLLPSVISILARSQDCVSVSVGGYLVNDPAISCEWGWVKDLKVAARAFALIYLAVPLCVAAYSARGLPGYKLFDFLGQGYHQMSYYAKYWECVTLFRKAVIFGIATKLVGLQDPRSQIIAIVLILSFSIAFHFSNWPFGVNGHYNDTLNWLDAYSIFASITVSLSIMVRVQSKLGKDLPVSVNQQNFLDFLALSFCGPFVLRWLFLFFDALFFEGWMEVKLEALLGGVRKVTRAWFAKNCAGCTRKRKPVLVSNSVSSGALLSPANGSAIGGGSGGDGGVSTAAGGVSPSDGQGSSAGLLDVKLSLPGAAVGGSGSNDDDGGAALPSFSYASPSPKEGGFEAPSWLRKRGTAFKVSGDAASVSTTCASASGVALEVVPTPKPVLAKVARDNSLTILVPSSSSDSASTTLSNPLSTSTRASNAQARNTFPPISPRSSSGSGGGGGISGVDAGGGLGEGVSTPNPIHAQKMKAEKWAEGVGAGVDDTSAASDSFNQINPLHPTISRGSSSKSSSSSSSSAFTSVSAGGTKGGGVKPTVSPLSSASPTEGGREGEVGGVGFSFQNPMRRL